MTDLERAIANMQRAIALNRVGSAATEAERNAAARWLETHTSIYPCEGCEPSQGEEIRRNHETVTV